MVVIRGLHIDEIRIDSDPGEESEPEAVQPAEETKEEPKKEEKPKAAPKPRKRVDKGKIGALYKAGWDILKIADEMRCDKSTVYKVVKELGLWN
jgi:hypothetical protein